MGLQRCSTGVYRSALHRYEAGTLQSVGQADSLDILTGNGEISKL